MNIFLNLLGYTGFAIAAIIGYYILNAFVFKKVKINKWIVLAATLAFWIIPMFIRINLPYNLGVLIPSAFVVIFMLWFMDLSGWRGFGGRNARGSKTTTTVERYNKGKDIVIKPKAKPNRVKNNKQ